MWSYKIINEFAILLTKTELPRSIHESCSAQHYLVFRIPVPVGTHPFLSHCIWALIRRRSPRHLSALFSALRRRRRRRYEGFAAASKVKSDSFHARGGIGGVADVGVGAREKWGRWTVEMIAHFLVIT